MNSKWRELNIIQLIFGACSKTRVILYGEPQFHPSMHLNNDATIMVKGFFSSINQGIHATFLR